MLYLLYNNATDCSEEFPYVIGVFDEFHLMYVYQESVGFDRTFYEEVEINKPLYD